MQDGSFSQAFRGTIIGAALQLTPEQKEIRLLKNMVTDLVQQNTESEKEIIANLRALAAANYDTAEEAFERIIAGLENISRKVYVQGFWTKTAYEPTIIPAVKALHGTISKRQIVYNSQIEESRKKQEAATQPKPVVEGEPTMADLMKKIGEMDLRHKADAEKTQQALQVAGQALNEVKTQLGYMTDASAQALLALPSNVRTVALAATGGETSQFALAIRDKLAAAETADPKNDLNILLTHVYNSAQGQNNIRFRIRFVQLLLRLYPRTLFLSDIIEKATKLFSAIGLSFEELDLVDGHLRDFQFKKDNIDNTPLTQNEISDFCEFARDADFGFDEETVRSFSTVNFNKTSEIEGIEKKIRLQLIRNCEDTNMFQWLGTKKASVEALLKFYDHGKPSDGEKLFIKYLLFHLLLYKNTHTTKSIIEDSKKHSKAVGVSDGLASCLAELEKTEETLTGKPLSALEAEIFSVMLSGKPANKLLRDDQPAFKAFSSLFSTKDHTIEQMGAAYERSFSAKVAKSQPGNNGLLSKSSEIIGKGPSAASASAPLQEQQQQQALASAAAAAALSRSCE